jgi:hypothetical protein|nr:MAG TPA: HIRAN protein [Caudoviricetes sp.]
MNILVFILLVFVAIFIGTYIFCLRDKNGEHDISSEDLLEKIKRTDLKTVEFKIRGIAFLEEEQRRIVFNLEEGEILYLRREPWNFIDRDAVAIFKGETKIGYIERPVNKDVLSYIKNNYRYQCRFTGKEIGENGRKEYFCKVVVECNGCNDRIPAGFTDPRKDNIYTNPRLKFPLGKQNYDFYEVPGEWIPCNWTLYGKETRYEVEDDPDLKELYNDNYTLMKMYLKELYNKEFLSIEEAANYFKFNRSDKFITKNKILGNMVVNYINSHEVDVD